MIVTCIHNPLRPAKEAQQKDLTQLKELFVANKAIWTDTTVEFPIIPPQVDLLITLGGDGSILSAIHALAALKKTATPILALNTGTLGFLATYHLPFESMPTWEEITSTPKVSHLPLTYTIKHKGELVTIPGSTPIAINDICLKMVGVGMFQAGLSVDGNHVTDYKGDGLVISTAVGSTAYNLSLGGPLVEPGSELLAFSPIAPPSLTNRSLVMPYYKAGQVREFKLTIQQGPIRLDVDGKPILTLQVGDEVTCKVAPEHLFNLLTPKTRNHFSYVTTKLGWNRQELQSSSGS